MKKPFLFTLLLTASIYSCELLDPTDGGILPIDGFDTESPVDFNIAPCDEGTNMDSADLPQVILDYLNDRFPNISIDDVEIFQQDGATAFGIRLGNDVEILFDLDGLVIGGSDDDDEDHIDLSDLPAGVIDYIDANYSGLTIDHAETELEYGETFIEVYLSDGTEIYFDLEGNFLCQDDQGSDDNDWDDNSDDDNHGDDDGTDDDDDDEDDEDDEEENLISVSNLPESIRNYVAVNYPDYSIQEAKKEDLCNDQDVYEVDLERENEENEPDLYFDLEGNFLFAGTEISADDLPDAVTAALETNYPGYRFDDDKIERHDYPDGSVQYEVEIETGDDDVDLVLAADGTILCRDE